MHKIHYTSSSSILMKIINKIKFVLVLHYLFILYLLLTILQLKISVPKKYSKSE